MYLWRKRVTRKWLAENESAVQLQAGERLATIEIPGKTRLIAEVSCGSLKEVRDLKKRFGGGIERIPRNWLKRFQERQKAKPIKVGKRLLISNMGGTSASRLRALSRRQGRSHIVI